MCGVHGSGRGIIGVVLRDDNDIRKTARSQDEHVSCGVAKGETMKVVGLLIIGVLAVLAAYSLYRLYREHDPFRPDDWLGGV